MRRLALLAAFLVCLLGAILAAPAAAQVPCQEPICEPEPEPTPTPEPEPTPEPDEEPEGRQPPPGPPPSPPSPVSGTVTYQADPGHTGWVPMSSLIAPLSERWTRRIAAGPPLSGDGRIYITGEGALRALDPRTGDDLWAVPTSGRLGAYDDGRLFVTAGGFLTAFAAADGRQLWTTEIDGTYSLSTTPVATGGHVYISTDSGSSAIVSLDAATGAQRWSASGNGTGNTPTVDADRVYASYACGWTYAWDRAGGRKRWNSTSDCSGGGGSTAVVSGGRLYVPENNAVHDAATGRVIGTYPGGTPVFADGVGIYRASVGEKQVMQAVDPASGRLIWSTPMRAGSGSDVGTSLAPLAVGSAVYTVTGGIISAHALRTGQLLWTSKPSGGTSTTDHSSGDSPSLGATPDLLLVAGASGLRAFESAFSPPPGGIDVGATDFAPFVGRTVEVGGLLGRDLRGRTREVVLETDRAPFGNGYRRAGTTRPNSDGYFHLPLKPDRTVRVRATAGGVRSPGVRIDVVPRYAFRARAAGRRVRVKVGIRGARDVRLAGRRAYVYLGRESKRRYQRLGSARLRTVGRGRSAGALTIRPLGGTGGKDFLTLCVPGQVRLGLGPADVLTKRCGRRSVRWPKR